MTEIGVLPDSVLVFTGREQGGTARPATVLPFRFRRQPVSPPRVFCLFLPGKQATEGNRIKPVDRINRELGGIYSGNTIRPRASRAKQARGPSCHLGILLLGHLAAANKEGTSDVDVAPPLVRAPARFVRRRAHPKSAGGDKSQPHSHGVDDLDGTPDFIRPGLLTPLHLLQINWKAESGRRSGSHRSNHEQQSTGKTRQEKSCAGIIHERLLGVPQCSR